MLVSFVFVPAVILWFVTLAVWTDNKRPHMTIWRATTFKWGLVSAAAGIILLARGSGRILADQSDTPLIWGVVNLVGVLLWLTSFGTAFTGKGAGRVLLLVSDAFALLAFFLIWTYVP